jgi:hypothetical protein
MEDLDKDGVIEGMDTIVSVAVLQVAIDEVQKMALYSSRTRFALPPEEWLRLFQQGLRQAADLAQHYLAVNFEAKEIHRQRRAIRRQIAREDLERALGVEGDEGT